MIRVLVADDHPVVREGIKQILADHLGVRVRGEAGSGAEAIAEAVKGEYDVVLMDISMPGRGGLDALREIKTLCPRLPVLILSVHEEEQYALRALKGGASGYLTKATLGDELVVAIEKVARGQDYISVKVAEKIAGDIRHGAERPRHAALSDREYTVLCHIAEGRTVSEIAEEMLLSVKTISTYRSRILEKMAMKNNAELMRYAMENGLV